MNRSISKELLEKYFSVTTQAYELACAAPVRDEASVRVVLDMVSRYISDAHHFRAQGQWTLAYGALNYAHGWLDAAARLSLFVVHDSRLFTVDDK